MNEYFAQTLAGVLEETSTNMGNAMVLNHLSKHGTVTLEEAEFYHGLCTDVITEAAEDFIPDEIEVPEQEEALPPIELFDAVGNKYVFQDGQLIPVDGDQDDDGMSDDQEVQGDLPVDADPETAQYAESETVDDKDDNDVLEESGAVVTESEVIAEESEVLEESSTVVARILANLK